MRPRTILDGAGGRKDSQKETQMYRIKERSASITGHYQKTSNLSANSSGRFGKVQESSVNSITRQRNSRSLFRNRDQSSGSRLIKHKSIKSAIYRVTSANDFYSSDVHQQPPKNQDNYIVSRVH